MYLTVWRFESSREHFHFFSLELGRFGSWGLARIGPDWPHFHGESYGSASICGGTGGGGTVRLLGLEANELLRGGGLFVFFGNYG